MTATQIKSIRKKTELSQTAFAALLGVSFATVNRWETGKTSPQQDRIARIKALQLANHLMPPLTLDECVIEALEGAIEDQRHLLTINSQSPLRGKWAARIHANTKLLKDLRNRTKGSTK